MAEEAPPAPIAEEPAHDTGGFRWPWQKRKEDEAPAPVEPPAVDQAEFEETGLAWGITDEDESVAAEWLETAPEELAPPEQAAPPSCPRRSAGRIRAGTSP